MSLQTFNQDLQSCCLHHLFEMQAVTNADTIALVCEEVALTYAELNRRANQLAYHLRSVGVTPSSHVGISMERSEETIVGLLAILKAGAAYVPLDPDYPQKRLDYLLKDAEIPVMLTRRTLRDRLSTQRASVVFLDMQEMDLTQLPDENPDYPLSPEHLAYIIYTSGSTGEPKGAMISHRAIVARMRAFLDLFGHEALQRQLHFISLSFDVSVEEIFPVLSSGGTLCIHPAPAKESTQAFLDRCRKLAITKLNMPVAYWHQIVNELRLLQQPAPPSLQLLVVGGESPSLARLRDWYRSMDHPSRFINVWGTTETAIFASTYEVPIEREAVERLTVLPIGRPIASTEIYILDEAFSQVPPQVAGELYIGGAGVGRGYLGRPELTAACFVPDPFSNEPGARLYKTGDIGRYLADSTIEFLGRRDQQIKIRGFRIEPGEIAAVLEQHPAVQDAVVIVREDQPEEKQLVAYVVPLSDADLNVEELQHDLRACLPDYMVPTSILFLRKLPLSSNGKIDHRALPDPALFESEVERVHVAPRTPLEETLTHICKSILGKEQVGIYDNLFDIGAHSLHVTQIISRVRQMLRFELSLLNIMETPYVAGLAEHIEAQQQEKQPVLQTYQPLVPLKLSGSLPPAFFVHPGSGSPFVYTNLVNCLATDRPCYGLQAPGLSGEQEPCSDLPTLATLYLNAIRSRQARGPYYLVGWSTGGAVAFGLAQQLCRQGEQIARLVLLDSSAYHFFYHPELYRSDDVAIMENLLLDFSSRLGKKISISLEAIRHLEPDEQISALIERAKQEELLPSEMSSQEIRQRLRVFRANIEAACSYRPAAFEGDMILINALEGTWLACPDPTLGWSEWVRGGIQILHAPGNHFTMFDSSNVRVLARILEEYL